MKINALCIIGSALLLTSCAAKVTSSIQKTYAPLDYKQEVIVFGIEEQMPPEAEKLGTIKVGDAGFTTNCNYAVVIDKAKTEARKVGGNALKITKHSLPDAISTCHRITANVLKVENIESYAVSAGTGEFDRALIGADYAIINVYRTGGQGSLVNYDLHLGDSTICRVTNNFCESIKINKDGLNSLWAKTETKEEIPINVEFGKVYYVRCSVSMGAFVGHPQIEIVGNSTGKSEYNAMQQKKNTKK
ncbi:hypothetical protein FACS1894201_05840 [Bacteroidia bacterium]|nr:hypothetical protein FACS1894201_05840 [Bacteroidia bacterium]